MFVVVLFVLFSFGTIKDEKVPDFFSFCNSVSAVAGERKTKSVNRVVNSAIVDFIIIVLMVLKSSAFKNL